jgi:voltage-gated potassium channel
MASREGDKPLRIARSIVVLATTIVLGGLVLFWLGHGRWSLSETLYVAVNAISTVGSHELEGLDHVRFGKLATVGIILAGLGAVAYFQSSLTAILVQGVIGERLRRGRMQKRIDKLKGHMIVCGVGTTGVHVVEELFATKTPFVVIDRSRELLEAASEEVAKGELLYVVGDATQDHVLMQAGVTRAAGLVAALSEDKDNLYVTLSARTLSADARIVTKAIGADASAKMMRAGANATVSPNMIGGRRLASELVRPTVVEFVDQMLHDKDNVLRLEEVAVPEGSFFVGKALRDVPIRAETKLLVVALRVDKKFIYNPEPSTELEVGSVLVVIGAQPNVARLRELVRRSTTLLPG